jgi:RNA polymerase sigma-70 factor (ECF subfamily)
MTPADDQAAVERVLAGDLSTFEQLVRHWQGPLVNLAYRFCGDRSRAEDMAQEAFLRAFRSLATWRKDAAFSTWLFALAVNAYRSEIRRIPPTVALDDIGERGLAASQDRGLQEEDIERAVRRAVHTLPAKYREAVVLFYFHEMDVQTAARSLGIPAGTVKIRLSRARDLLRSKLKPFAGESRLEEAK